MRNFIILSLLLMMLSCYEKQEGCLDFRASNYDFGADKSCDDCCTYPNMKLKVTHNWGDTTLMRDSIYTGFSGSKIRIVEVKFFLSELFFTTGSEKETILETLLIEDINGIESEIPNNYTLVEDSRFSYNIGTFDMADIYDGISFSVGINGKYSSEETDDYPTLFDETTFEYTNFRMKYVLEDISSDTLLFEIKGPETSVPIQLNATLDIPLGVDFTIPLNIFYDKLLDNITLSTLNTQAGQNQFISNYFGAISF